MVVREGEGMGEGGGRRGEILGYRCQSHREETFGSKVEFMEDIATLVGT